MAKENAKKRTTGKKTKKRKSILGHLLRFAVLCAFISLVAVLSGLGGLYLYFSKDLPQIFSLKDYQPLVVSTLYSDDGRKIAEFFKERRYVIPLFEMPKQLTEAFVAAEDSRFYTHQGVDLFGILRALFKNIEAGSIVQGGGTITQQVTRSFLLSPEKSFSRKIREAILAYRIDKAFKKKEILYLYLNQIYLGHGAYGVEAAARSYFGKPARSLNLAECALLAGLPQAPSKYSPLKHPKKAKQRQVYVLNRMVEEGTITNIQATEAINAELAFKPKQNGLIEEVPYYAEYVRQYVEEKYGKDVLYSGGLSIHTAANIEMQKAANEAISKGLLELDKRHGFRGPEKHLGPAEIESFSRELQAKIAASGLLPGSITQGIVIAVSGKKGAVTVRMGSQKGTIAPEDIRWARKPEPEPDEEDTKPRAQDKILSPGDMVFVRIKEKAGKDGLWPLALEQDPAAQCALLCVETHTGHVKAMVGGANFNKSQFNRAIQAKRQPGSAFKPLIYSAALDKAFTPASVLIDSPIVFTDADSTWKPKNYTEKFLGPVLLRDALAHSRNVVTIKLLQRIGVDYAMDYARKMGITSPLDRNLSLALGSSAVSVLELVKAYTVFANEGVLVEPCFITRIVNARGKVLEECPVSNERVISQSTAYVMTRLLQGVVEYGTGTRVKALNRPVAGKTGTTNNLCDAWFVGYTPRYVTGVWVGFDDEQPLGEGETGSQTASPIWLDFMSRVLVGEPVRDFPVPDGVVFAKIDAKTGLLAIPESEKAVVECFKEGTAPTQYTEPPGVVEEPDSLLKSDM